MRRITLPAVAVALLLLGSGRADAKAAEAAHLDRTFGRDGRVTLPIPGSRVAAVAPDGSLILSSKSTVMRFGSGSAVLTNDNSLLLLTSDGRLDRSFGEDGVVTPSPVAGGAFALAGVAVDSQGRVIVAGTSTPPQPSPSVPKESPPPFELLSEPDVTSARILRYLPNGALDPSFGEQGVVDTDFGLPPPMSEGRQVTPAPLVKVTGVAIDDSGRIVLTGGAGAGLRSGCGHDWFWNTLTYAAFVVRLTESGAPDSTFGRDGLFGGLAASENPLRAEFGSEPVISPSGAMAFLRGEGACPRAAGFPGVARLTAAGEPLGLGEGHPNRDSIVAAAATKDGSLYLLELPHHRPGEPPYVRVLSLGPNGSLNRSFGRDGRATVKIPGREQSDVESIAVDSHGRVLLGGVEFPHRPRGLARGLGRPSFLVLRLRAQGGLDGGFGDHGAIVIRFPSLNPRGAAPRLRLDEQGRVVLSGNYWRAEDDRGLAAVRFVFGR